MPAVGQEGGCSAPDLFETPPHVRLRVLGRDRNGMRTAASVPLSVELRNPVTTPIYQSMAAEAAELRERARLLCRRGRPALWGRRPYRRQSSPLAPAAVVRCGGSAPGGPHHSAGPAEGAGGPGARARRSDPAEHLLANPTARGYLRVYHFMADAGSVVLGCPRFCWVPRNLLTGCDFYALCCGRSHSVLHLVRVDCPVFGPAPRVFLVPRFCCAGRGVAVDGGDADVPARPGSRRDSERCALGARSGRGFPESCAHRNPLR